MFDIRDHVQFTSTGRAHCPHCDQEQAKGRALSIDPDSGAYKCFRGCTTEQIRAAIGIPKAKQTPANLTGKRSALSSRETVERATKELLASKLPLDWLKDRTIFEENIERHQLGLYRAKVGKKTVEAIGIPFPAGDGFYVKKRLAPWADLLSADPEYSPWKQWGIPPLTWFTRKPKQAKQTWLCEGEWDAIVLADELDQKKDTETAIACFNCGAGSVPPQAELDKLIGNVTVFYDLDKAGREGAEKVARALGDRAAIAVVPSNEDAPKGWDVSDALLNEFPLADFRAAAAAATQPPPQKQSNNPLRDRLLTNDELIDTAPEYTEWLVPDILTQNELFLLAAGARTGKTLLAMTLAHAVATGSEFLSRPTTQGTVLFVEIEDSPGKIRERQQAQGWERGLPIVWLPKFKLSELPHLAEIAAEIDDLRLIVIDTLSRVKDSNVNESSAEMSAVLDPLQDLAISLDCCVVLVHHTGKVNAETADKVDLFDTIRGSSAIRAVCRGSMVLAASDRSYRLVCENGWGKHDLKVILDANTLEWKLIGKWSPVQNMTQKDQIVDYLKLSGEASIEQLHEATGIDKKSLYTQLSRLQTSDNAGDRVIKRGSRRKYTYSLAIFNTSQQLNSVLNSSNEDVKSDTGYSQQNNFLLGGDEKVLSELDASDEKLNSVDYSPETHAEQGFRLFNNYSTLFNTGDVVELQAGTHHGKTGRIIEVSELAASIQLEGWAIPEVLSLSNLKLLQRGEEKSS